MTYAKWIKCTISLAAFLIFTLSTIPANAGDFGQDMGFGAYETELTIGPFDPGAPFGPQEQGIRADDGKPGTNVSGVNSGLIRDVATKSGTFGTAKWRFNLVSPVWFPVLDFFAHLHISE
jgi:hypothetical protein